MCETFTPKLIFNSREIHLLACFLKNSISSIREQHSFPSHTEEVQRFPMDPCPPHTQGMPRYHHTPPPECSRAPTDGPTSTADTRVRSGCVQALGLDKWIMTCVRHYSTTQSSYTVCQPLPCIQPVLGPPQGKILQR